MTSTDTVFKNDTDFAPYNSDISTDFGTFDGNAAVRVY